jgi:hypothetical protein
MTRRTDPRTTRLPVPAGELPPFTPVPRQCARHDGWTDERQIAFIEALADTGSVQAACKAVDMSTVGAYHLRRQPGAESFREAWQAALQLGVARVEDVVMDRALNGVEEPLYSYGKLIGTRTRYNDRLLMFILRNRAPDRFAEGKPKAMNAVDQMEVERLKKQWRKEWEAEAERSTRHVSHAEVCASIDRKIEEVRRVLEARRARQWERLTEETREAWARFVELRDRDLDAMQADEAARKPMEVQWDTPHDPFEHPTPPPQLIDGREHRPAETEDAMPKPGPDFRMWQPPAPPPPKTEWRLTDDGFKP